MSRINMGSGEFIIGEKRSWCQDAKKYRGDSRRGLAFCAIP